jgi:hypothetical protein
VQVAQNFASHTGGAFYLRPYEAIGSAGGGAILCAYDFRIDGNAAQEGAAIYADADYDGAGNPLGGAVALNTNPGSFNSVADYPCVETEPPTALGAVACAAGVPCNVMTANKAEDANGNPTDGSTILLQDNSKLFSDRFSLRLNTGSHVLREVADNTTYNSRATFTNCLLADNVLTQELIAQTGGTGAYLLMDSCTIAGNQIGAPYTFLAPGTFELFGSIVDQPGHATIDPSITDPNSAAHVLTNDRSTLPDTVYIQQGEPTFVDAVNGNYRLTLASLGIDSAPIQTSYITTTLDLDRRLRVFDEASIPNNFGPKDLGAYELQPACAHADTVYCDGFEIQ